MDFRVEMKYFSATPGIQVPRLRLFVNDVPLSPPFFSREAALVNADALLGLALIEKGTHGMPQSRVRDLLDRSRYASIPEHATEDDIDSNRIVQASMDMADANREKHVYNLAVNFPFDADELHPEFPLLLVSCGDKKCCPGAPCPGVPYVEFCKSRGGNIQNTNVYVTSQRLVLFLVEAAMEHPELKQFLLPEVTRRTIETALMHAPNLPWEHRSRDRATLAQVERAAGITTLTARYFPH